MRAKHEVPTKYCLNCGAAMSRKRYNGQLEDRARFLQRKYCDPACAGMSFRKESVSLPGLYKRAIKFRASACQTCGSTEKGLGIHHIDRNPANNSAENLLTLCASCHTRLHWQEGKAPWKERSPCKVCGDPARRHGLCQKHWFRFKKYGDPNLTKRHGRSGPILKHPMPDTIAPTNCDCLETELSPQPQSERSGS